MEPIEQEPDLHLPPGVFKAFLFDLDGTVADSMPLHYVAWKDALAEHGNIFPEETFYAWGGIPPARIVEMLNEQHGLTLSPAAVMEHKERMYVDALPTMQPIASVLKHIHASHGSMLFAIVSGSPRASIAATLDVLGLTAYFPLIVGSEDYERGKPDPEPFLTAARLLGVQPEDCLVFEDAKAGIDSAQAAGMQWVHVPAPKR